MNTTKEESSKRKKSKKKKDEIFAGNRREMSIVLHAEMFDLAKAKNKSEVKKNKLELVYNFWWQ